MQYQSNVLCSLRGGSLRGGSLQNRRNPTEAKARRVTFSHCFPRARLAFCVRLAFATVPLKAGFHLDCEQSLSFPSVFRAIERTSRGSSSGEWWAANREKRERGKKEKERDCGGIFDLFDLPPLTPVWLMVPPSLQSDTISRPSHYNSSLVVRT